MKRWFTKNRTSLKKCKSREVASFLHGGNYHNINNLLWMINNLTGQYQWMLLTTMGDGRPPFPWMNCMSITIYLKLINDWKVYINFWWAHKLNNIIFMFRTFCFNLLFLAHRQPRLNGHLFGLIFEVFLLGCVGFRLGYCAIILLSLPHLLLLWIWRSIFFKHVQKKKKKKWLRTLLSIYSSSWKFKHVLHSLHPSPSSLPPTTSLSSSLASSQCKHPPTINTDPWRSSLHLQLHPSSSTSSGSPLMRPPKADLQFLRSSSQLLVLSWNLSRFFGFSKLYAITVAMPDIVALESLIRMHHL